MKNIKESIMTKAINYVAMDNSELLRQLDELLAIQSDTKEKIPHIINEIIENAVLAICQNPARPNFRTLEVAIEEISHMRGGEKIARKIVEDIPAYLDLVDILLIKDCRRAGDKKALWQIAIRPSEDFEERILKICNSEYVAFMEYKKEKASSKTVREARLDKTNNFEKALAKLYGGKLSKEIQEHIDAIKKAIG